MIVVFRRGIPLLLGVFVVGCSPGVHSLRASESTVRISPLVADYAATESSQSSLPVGQITVQEAIALALMRNPALASYSWEIRAREAEAHKAVRRPNPELAVEIENFAGSGESGGLGGSETTVALSQLFELGGKREHRFATARSAQSLAEWDYEIARLRVFHATRASFLTVLAAQRQLGLAEELSEVAQELLASVSRRVQAGSTSAVEEHLARVQVETSRIEVSQAESDLAVARTRLSLNWGSQEATFAETVGDFETILVLPTLKSLQAQAEQNPVLARWDAELNHQRASALLERSLGRPDLSLGGGLRFLSGLDDAAFVMEFGLPLPIFDRNSDEVEAATLRVRRIEADRDAAKVGLLGQISMVYGTLLAADAEVNALRDRALPEATTAFEAAEQAYLRGSMQFAFVLETERQFFELKSRYFDALVRYHTAVADVERLTGASLAGRRDEIRENK